MIGRARQEGSLMSIQPVPEPEDRTLTPPVPVGAIVLVAFRVTGYDRDCDGTLMARLENVDVHGEATEWEENAIGLYPDTAWTIDNLNELRG